jgi:hydrogenase nickel incorporation protein HypA/HybF
MHELSFVRRVVAIACERAGGRRVRAVHLRVGELSGVDVAAVQFCYEVCADGTAVAGSRLEIERVPGAARCTGCGRALALEEPVAVCPCERGALLERTAGDELLVTALEVDDV